MHGKVFKSHFDSKFEEQKIRNHVRSSIPSILRVFFEFYNLSKTPKIIFFDQHFFRGFEKIRETSIFWTFLNASRRNEIEKKIFSDFFETMLEMFSILKYIFQKEILAEKNYFGCFREVIKFKKYT